jgi:hypothetical protein
MSMLLTVSTFVRMAALFYDCSQDSLFKKVGADHWPFNFQMYDQFRSFGSGSRYQSMSTLGIRWRSE